MNIKENIKETLNNNYNLSTKEGRISTRRFNDRRRKKKEELRKSIVDDLNKNHNHTWYEEIYDRNKNSLDDIALFYRGTEITYGEMFDRMNEYAKALKASGIKYNDEIPVCMSNSPELIYLLGAISILGAKANIFGFDFDKEYLRGIINNCSSNIAFIEDNYYNEIKDILPENKKIVLTSLATSLTDKYDKYKKYDEVHRNLFIDKTEEILKENNNTMSLDSFINKGKDIEENIKPHGNLDTEFSITYSSGTTSNTPKEIVHTTRSFITIGRCHDSDIQRSASMKKFTIQSNAPSFSNTDLISNISDTFMQGAKLALEPVYDGYGDFFLDSLLINKPTYVIGTRSLWLRAFKKIERDPNYKNTKLDFLLVPFAVGEGIDPGEEKYINKGLRKAKAGRQITKTPLFPITISLAGGDCEHGGIFWRLFRSMANKTPGYLMRKEPCGMKAFEIVDYAVLDENGNYCKPYEYGRLVANSPCTMKGYKNNEEATKKFFIHDATGKTWGDCSVYAYLDYKDNIHMRGRIPKNKDEIPIPNFMVTDAVTKDTKNILSCETIYTGDVYVIHLELQPTHKAILDVLNSIEERLAATFGQEILNKTVYRIHNLDGFKTTHSGKRDIRLLEDEGISKAIKPVKIAQDMSFIGALEFINNKEEKQLQYKK